MFFYINCHPVFLFCKVSYPAFFLLKTPVLPIVYKYHPSPSPLKTKWYKFIQGDILGARQILCSHLNIKTFDTLSKQCHLLKVPLYELPFLSHNRSLEKYMNDLQSIKGSLVAKLKFNNLSKTLWYLFNIIYTI